MSICEATIPNLLRSLSLALSLHNNRVREIDTEDTIFWKHVCVCVCVCVFSLNLVIYLYFHVYILLLVFHEKWNSSSNTRRFGAHEWGLKKKKNIISSLKPSTKKTGISTGIYLENGNLGYLINFSAPWEKNRKERIFLVKAKMMWKDAKDVLVKQT